MNVFALSVLYLTTCVGVSLQDNVKMSVYYETLCPDSVSFVRGQLKPTFDKLKDYIELDLIPYGKAIQNKKDGKWEFECQHGRMECYGNKIQACLLHQNLTQEKNLNFINCFLKGYNPNRAGQPCATAAGIDWEPINHCANSQLGGDLLAHYGDRTHALVPSLSFVPTVYFNDTYDVDLHYRSLHELYKITCKFLSYPKPCQATEEET